MKLARLTDSHFRLALARLATQPIPLRTAFKLKNIMSEVDVAVARFEEVRRSGLERYGSKGDDGQLLLSDSGTVQFTEENLSMFAAELNELGKTEINLATISIDELGDKVLISTDDIAALSELVTQ